MRINTNKLNKQQYYVLLGLLIVILAAAAVNAADPVFLNIVEGQQFNAPEDQLFTFYVLSQDADLEYPLNFSDTAGSATVQFYSFNMVNYNTTASLINFTPNNDDVGIYNFHILLIDSNAESDTVSVIFNVSNVNDAPNITSNTPEDLVNITLQEGFMNPFEVTVEDVDLPHGDTLYYTWLIDYHINRSILNWTDNQANYTPDFLSAGQHNITIIVNDSENLNDTLMWQVNVTNNNRVPININPIPNITVHEDSERIDAFNLSDFFIDPDTDDTISYNFTFITGNDLNITIDAFDPHNVTIRPETDFSGSNIVQFRCFDGYNYTSSNNVTINVTPENDPPVVEQLENQTAYADTQKTIQVEADDAEDDPLTYTANESFVNMGLNTGLMDFTAIAANIGNYSILVNVSDGMNYTLMVFNLSVRNNSAPVIQNKPLPDLTFSEGALIFMQFNATDVDLTDELTLWSTTNKTENPEDLNITITNTSSTAASGYISFTPDQTDVGTYRVTIYVNDTKGAEDNNTFILNITDVEHNPELDTIPNQRMKTDVQFNYILHAIDEDGNILLFDLNTTMFTIGTVQNGFDANGTISFTPNSSHVGLHLINFTINDTTGRYDWQTVLFNITYNEPPTLTTYNFTTYEDSLFQITINASDPDPQDTITYTDNTSLFDVDLTGIISWTPNSSHIGTHSINITVSDGEYNVSGVMNITVMEFNDYPFWIPPLEEYWVNETNLTRTDWEAEFWSSNNTNMTVWNSSIFQNNLTRIYLDAYDEESTPLSFSIEYINFTNASNDTVTTGIELINFTSYDADTALANLTPNNSQVGKYYINFTVDDNTGRTNTTTIMLEVFNVNDEPEITSYTPTTTYYLNMTENSSMMFNISARDIDYQDELRYVWSLNNTNITGANTTSYNYTADFLSAGWRNLTATVIDLENATTSVSWIINISNVNRMGWFGRILETEYDDFNSGIQKNNITILDLGYVLLDTNATGYLLDGMFESSVLDTTETNSYHQYSTINWDGNLTGPPGSDFDIYFQTRTVHVGNPLSPCPSTIITPYIDIIRYTSSGSNIMEDSDRCIQYRFFLSTNDQTSSPNISMVRIEYDIASKTQEQRTNQSWIDLGIYFQDPDTDDTLNFTVTAPDNSTIIDVNITIDDENRVYVVTDSVFIGSLDVVFHMSDGEYTITSNTIILNITEVETITEPIIIPVGGGGGGATSNPVPYEVPEYITTPVSFRLIAPQIATTYENDTIQIPINIFNSNFTIEDLKLTATTANENVNLELSKEYITKMEPNQKEFITLTVESYKTYGSYEIIIEAEADAISAASDGTTKKSKFTERAKIFVNSLLKAEGNESQVNTKLAFAEDLLSSNPECLELNEFLGKSRDMIDQGKIQEAGKMLDKVIESCKYLVAPKEKKPIVETPFKVYGMQTESLLIMGIVAIVTALVSIALVVGWSHRKTKRKESMKKL
ncbi:hypothetical protein HQ545_01185 [Candidatus Woesearchaeota archaeon]|nr:hypothetical protein [Candidatus Woesearchaeota archaeon]